jgi:hypothetical protein
MQQYKNTVKINLRIDLMGQSTAVGLNLGFDCLTLDTDEFSILATVTAEGVAPEPACEEEQAQTPHNGDGSDFLSGDVAGVLSTSRAW